MGLSQRERSVIINALWEIESQARQEGFAFGMRAVAMAKIEAIVRLRNEQRASYTLEEFTELYKSYL